MNRRSESLIGCAVTAALFLAPAACKHSNREPVAQVAAAPAKPSAAPAQTKLDLDNAQIATAQALIDRDPTDANGWIALGNAYFDAARMQEAVKAYDKALALKPDNPEVLTDQGVMYRELGQYDKAMANFKNASTLNPRHQPSILDLGVLYAQDLKDAAKAMQAWNRVIEIDPESSQASKARWYIEQMNHLPKVQ